MSVIKPDEFIFTKNVFQWKNKYYASLSAALGFSLDKPHVIATEHELQNIWPTLNLESAIDEGYPKSRAEILVMGHVKLPQDKQPSLIHLKMQGIDKKLAVHGHKVWEKIGFNTLDTKLIVQAEDSVPLAWEHAFGGTGFLANPSGKGFAPSRFDFSDPKKPIAYPHFMSAQGGVFNPTVQTVEPDCLAPLPLLHPLRQRYFNATKTYWLEQGGLPTLPDHLDLAYFQQAPRNQQRDGFFQAGEEFALSGMGAEIKSTLPDVNVRLFTTNRKRAVSEYVPQCDTFMLIPEHNLGIMLFRVTVPVQDIHANEHSDYLLALESSEFVQSAQFYQQQLYEYLGPHAVQTQLQPRSPPFWNKSVAKTLAHPDLFKAERIGAQFFANLELANLDLSQKSFQQIQFSRCLFKNVSLKESQFQDVQFMDCEFENCNLNESQWTDSQWMNTTLHQSEWKGAALTQVILYRVRANQLALQGTYFNKVQVTQGIWKHVDLRYSRLIEARFHQVEIQESNLSQMEASQSTLTGKKMLLSKVKMEQGHWEGMNFLESTFYRCSIKNNQFPGGEWASTRFIRVEFHANEVTNNTFVDSLWLGVHSQDNDFSYSFFRGAHFKYSKTTDNNWQHVDLRHVRNSRAQIKIWDCIAVA